MTFVSIFSGEQSPSSVQASGHQIRKLLSVPKERSPGTTSLARFIVNAISSSVYWMVQS